jgi:hypothetical protein
MSHWVLDLLDEPTVFWPPPSRDGYGGVSVWEIPVQINGRWQYSIGAFGDTIEYNRDTSTIHGKTSVWLDTSIPVGSWLWKGLISEIPPPGTPQEVVGVAQVISVKRVRSLVDNEYLNKVYLGTKGA